MGASIDDISITIISNGETAYYSSYKGIGNILWEVDFGLYSNKKPNAFKIFDFAKNTSWKDGIRVLDKPLEDPSYGILTVNFDTKTIIDDNGYGPWDGMFLQWFVNAIFKYANREVKGYGDKAILTKKTVIEHLKNGNLYIGGFSRKDSDLMLPNNIDDTYDLLINLGYESVYSTPIAVIDKGYRWGQIKPPKDWTIVTPEDDE
jgi:hypothetical protein